MGHADRHAQLPAGGVADFFQDGDEAFFLGMIETKLDGIHLQDCIAGMQSLAEGSIDLVFADPPFNIGYDYDVYHDKKGPEQYLAWSRDWINGVHRVLKSDGTFWLAIGDDFAAELECLHRSPDSPCFALPGVINTIKCRMQLELAELNNSAGEHP
jgi:tRNA1(Val) A37 N6-methylase TrmN6